MGNKCTNGVLCHGDGDAHPKEPQTNDPATSGGKGAKNGANKDALSDEEAVSEDEQKEAEKQPKKNYRILLLGAGESGKTTFTQQLNLIHNLTQISPEERKKNTLQAQHENIVQVISATAANANRIGLQLSGEDKERLESVKMSTKLDSVVAEDVELLWNSEAMRESYSRKNSYWVLDTAEWLMANVRRFSAEQYMPERNDVILSRRRTTGITEHTYVVDDASFTLIDVGGQRSERRKWVQFFADVHCIVFFVSAIGFCKVLFEDKNQNQMKESLELFTSTFRVPVAQTGPRIDNDWQDYVFETTPIHVVFNKIDMLDDMLSKFQFSTCFPAYHGTNTKRAILQFLQQIFSDRVVSIRSPPDTHYISATNEIDVQEIFTKLTKFLLEKERAGHALNAFMALEQRTNPMKTNALDRRPTKANKTDDANSKKRQRQRQKRVRELMCDNS